MLRDYWRISISMALYLAEMPAPVIKLCVCVCVCVCVRVRACPCLQTLGGGGKEEGAWREGTALAGSPEVCLAPPHPPGSPHVPRGEPTASPSLSPLNKGPYH